MALARASTPALAIAMLLLLAGAAAEKRTKISKKEGRQIVEIYEANPKILKVIRELIKDIEHWKRAKKGGRGLLQGTEDASYNTTYTDSTGATYTGSADDLDIPPTPDAPVVGSSCPNKQICKASTSKYTETIQCCNYQICYQPTDAFCSFDNSTSGSGYCCCPPTWPLENNVCTPPPPPPPPPPPIPYCCPLNTADYYFPCDYTVQDGVLTGVTCVCPSGYVCYPPPSPPPLESPPPPPA